MKKLVIMRGIPGGGKSTRVRLAMAGYVGHGVRSMAVCSTDDEFLNKDGVYVFDATKLHFNHKNNQAKCQRMMMAEVQVIFIDNTNTTHKEMAPYKDLAKSYGYDVEEIIVGEENLFPGMDGRLSDFEDYIDMCAKRNTHGVPRDAILKMARRFER